MGAAMGEVLVGDGAEGEGPVAVVVVCDVDGVERRRFVVSRREVEVSDARGELFDEVEGALLRERDRCGRVLGAAVGERGGGVTRGPVTLVPPPSGPRG